MEKKRLSVRPIMLGLATAMGAYLVLLTLAAYLTVSGRLDEVRIGQAVWACACLSAFGGAMMTLRGKRGVAALPLLAAAAFWVCVSLLGLLTSDAPDLNGVLGLLAASALGGLLAAGLARREKGKRAKRRQRNMDAGEKTKSAPHCGALLAGKWEYERDKESITYVRSRPACCSFC